MGRMQQQALRLGIASFAAVAMAAVVGVATPGSAGAAPSVSAASSSVAAAEDFALLYQNKETTTYTHTSETTYAVRASARYAAEQDTVNIRPAVYGGYDYDKGHDYDKDHDYKKPHHAKQDHEVKPAHHKKGGHKQNGIVWHDLKATGCSGGWYGGKYHASMYDKVGFIPSDFHSHHKGTKYTVIMKHNGHKDNAVYKPNLSWHELNNYRHSVKKGGGAWMQVNAYEPGGNVKYYRANLMVH
jgi:hypothetical protein